MAVEMRDRLGQLRHTQQSSIYNYNYDDFGVEETALEDDPEFLGSFFQTLEDIICSINMIRQHSEQIKLNYNCILASVQNINEAKKETDNLTNEVKKLSHRVHAELKCLKQDVDEEKQGPQRNTANFRIKKAQVNTLSRKFKEVMEEHNQIQEDYRDKNKDHILRQLKCIGKSVTEDEVEDMLESKNLNFFTQSILADTVDLESRQTLGEIEARHQEILQLEENIKELHEMFCDMALLVEEQGEIINRIEYNVKKAAEYVQQGMNQLQVGQSTIYHENNRLKLMIGLIIGSCVGALIIVIVIIIVAVAVSRT